MNVRDRSLSLSPSPSVRTTPVAAMAVFSAVLMTVSSPFPTPAWTTLAIEAALASSCGRLLTSRNTLVMTAAKRCTTQQQIRMMSTMKYGLATVCCSR